MDRFDLPLLGNHRLVINPICFTGIFQELEDFLQEDNGMNSIEFVKRILFNLEIKSNNTVEGINDDLSFIEDVIKNTDHITIDEKRKRVINLYHGYKYILKHRDINQESVRELYSILSDGLLSTRDRSNMGEYYREAPVYILDKGRLDLELDQGIPYDQISYFMDKYFDFANSDFSGTMTEKFIKSQIMHFYFVFIHPYFDVNGRTSRTIAMWDLLNEKAYPYIIFNRAINFADSSYDDTISKCKNMRNVSPFISYMMVNVKKELEKEMIMREIKANTPERMSAIDFQALQYILSMNGEVNTLTFSTMYRERNGRKAVRDIYNDVLEPLLDKGIILVDRESKKKMFDGKCNQIYKINPERYDRENPKIKRLSLENK